MKEVMILQVYPFIRIITLYKIYQITENLADSFVCFSLALIYLPIYTASSSSGHTLINVYMVPTVEKYY